MVKNPPLHPDGYIKFDCVWQRAPALPEGDLCRLKECRDALRRHNYIGVYSSGIGFGNVSMRYNGDQFIISGSGTGAKEKSTDNDFTLVTSCDAAKNRVCCAGPVQASSESLSHAALYACDLTVGAVIHIHNRALWQSLLYSVPTTSSDVTYGTPEMAAEIKRLYTTTTLPQKKILAMAGHEEGIIICGVSLSEALTITFSLGRSSRS